MVSGGESGKMGICARPQQGAEVSGRSVKTISSQKVAAMDKLGLRSALEQFAYARQHKL